MEQFDFLVIGAGVVGLAITAELTQSLKNYSLILMEKHNKFGQETSSRNSEVVHSGIYYPSGSLKAKLCVAGKQLLYKFCKEQNIPHQGIGKLIIARNEGEIAVLEGLMKQGNENCVLDLEMLDSDQVHKIEPHIKASAALYSPSTGIVDSHILMERLESISENHDAIIAYGHEVIGIEKSDSGYTVTYRTNGCEDKLGCRFIVNCAGLNSDKIASMTGIDVETAGYRLFPCKGEYFSVRNSKAKQIAHLIYPPPLKELKGLGIHVTKSLDGYIRLGPNAFYVDSMEYDVDVSHKDDFYNAASEYLPFLEYQDIEADMAGIRPKLQGPGDTVRDFIIRHEADRGLPGVINLIGIESPGLTSCLSISKYVWDLIGSSGII